MELSIDISDRDVSLHRFGVPYRLTCEACLPYIETSDLCSVFEEHQVCASLEQLLANRICLSTEKEVQIYMFGSEIMLSFTSRIRKSIASIKLIYILNMNLYFAF
ncbi:unnamed protein product [Protopolystoma xenopodis]|uniref:Uncharacterized protein n=1 Tax=Protopolystoma xenopodis TaxID=117903 RepID=A0A3S5B085_9PLAT|nr:unnamed protein product [Protopolystoma xenopodis]